MTTLPLASAPWQFRDATVASRWRTATVPGCVHRDLLRHGLIPDPFFGTNELDVQWVEQHDWEYRAPIRVPATLLAGENLDLVCDGLDTLATIFINDRVVTRSDNMFTPLRIPVRRFLRAGRNDLRIRFASAARAVKTLRPSHHPQEFNDPVGRSSTLRKQACQFGWDWAPRLLTAGIWRDLRLEAWTGPRLADVRLTQTHAPDGSVTLSIAPEVSGPGKNVTYCATLSLDGNFIAETSGAAKQLTATIARPQLWWPNTLGAQPLYTIDLIASDDAGREFGRWSRRIGLRTIVLDRTPDKHGEAFRFIVNDRPVFIKGSNWVPVHSFVAGLTRDDYARDVRATAAANLNLLRVWGGGIYEDESFYDLCDELGLLVWQDFMFACTLYPGDRAFLASARAEADAQVRRLRHRACLALWCGNNEIETLNWTALQKTPALRRNYDALFHRTLPTAVVAHDGVTPYWPTSPSRGPGRSNDYTDTKLGEISGDTHYWSVWGVGRSPKNYEQWRFRFVSEFGMQSFASPEMQDAFCPPGETNPLGPVMDHHQKHTMGNAIVLDHVSRHYRFPKNYAALSYVSELNEAWSVQAAVEHWRRNMPHCMGAIYWQLNDCWPVTSASSIEFNGRWKALHHLARRFFAPALATAHAPGAETVILGNYRRSTAGLVHLYSVYDAPEPARGVLLWDLFRLDGHVLLGGRKNASLRYGKSIRQRTLDLTSELARHGRDNVVLRVALEIGDQRVSEESVFFTLPRFLALPRGKTEITTRSLSPTQALLTFRSAVFQHRFSFELPGLRYTASDNFFELYPGERKDVHITFAQPITKSALTRTLRTQSLVDSYV